MNGTWNSSILKESIEKTLTTEAAEDTEKRWQKKASKYRYLQYKKRFLMPVFHLGASKKDRFKVKFI